MAIGERDPHTGHMTTGHEWNGIKELNTPVPRAVYFFLAATVAFSVVYWLLMPAWPLGVTYTKGLLGIDQRTTVTERLKRAAADRAVWTKKIQAADFKDIQADERLMRIVRQTGRTLFGDNCAVCHGVDAKGRRGYPNLTSGAWAWGGDPETIAETLRVGINSGHSDTRVSAMPAFGDNQTLARSDIANVMTYVQSLSESAPPTAEITEKVRSGEETFAASCAGCHGEHGQGTTFMGAPNLADNLWIYGGDRRSIFTTIYSGRQGHMPHWDTRLTPVDRKILTLYVLDLGSAKK